jgi:hypothetical protein
MLEKIVLAIAVACSLYLNIQFKPQPKSLEIGVGYPVEIHPKSQSVAILSI